MHNIIGENRNKNNEELEGNNIGGNKKDEWIGMNCGPAALLYEWERVYNNVTLFYNECFNEIVFEIKEDAKSLNINLWIKNFKIILGLK